MKTSWAYAPIGIFVGIAVFLAWPEPVVTPDAPSTEDQIYVPAPEVTTDATTVAPETITITGTLVGYVAVSESTGVEYTAALINDGIEVLRIDLRQLPDYSESAVETILGVEVNQVVVLEGQVEDGVFVAARVII